MSTRRASSRKRSNTNKDYPVSSSTTDGNILNHKRGQQHADGDTFKKLRLLENLRTKETKITCCDFGSDREHLFLNFFFCHECKQWENRDRGNKRLYREMKAYKCKVNHRSYVVPEKKNNQEVPI